MATRRRAGRSSQTEVEEPVRLSQKAVSKTTKDYPHTSRVNQFLINLCLAAPWILILTYPLSNLSPILRNTPYTVQEVLQQLYESLHVKRGIDNLVNLKFNDLPNFWLLAAILSTPHVYYFLIWTNSKIYYSFCSKYLKFIGEPYQVLAYSAHCIKLMQGISLVIWFCGLEWLTKTSFSGIATTALDSITKQHPFQVLLGAELFMIGQVFNTAVYSTIGETGVYYGCRLGKHIPWVYGFPFNTASHPQYFGATLTVWGVCCLFASPHTVDLGIYAVGILLSIYYVFSSAVEQYL